MGLTSEGYDPGCLATSDYDTEMYEYAMMHFGEFSYLSTG